MSMCRNFVRHCFVLSGIAAFVAGALLAGIATPTGAAEAGPPGQMFVEIPAEESGLVHRVRIRTKDEPVTAGLSYTWMSPLVDIDGDGNLDILYYGHHGGGAAVWLGKGDGTFAFDETGYGSRWVFGGRDPIWWDFTGDGQIDGTGTEGYGIRGFLFVNDGTGHWEKTALQVPGRFIDLDADGRHDEVFAAGGTGFTLEPEPGTWSHVPPDELTVTAVWKAEDVTGWPEGEERSGHPLSANFRDAYSVDLDGDFRNELILCFSGTLWAKSGPGLRSWILRMDDGEWKDSTPERGLPTGRDHWFFPEDVDMDADLDLIDLGTGEIYENDGKGRFARGDGRVFDPATRKGGGVWSGDGEIQMLDLDNNGRRDMVISADHTTENGVFMNRGEGGFAEVGGIPGNRRARKFGDVDGDFDMDMIAARGNPPRMVLHRNESKGAALQLRVVPKAPAQAHLGCTVWVHKAGGSADDGVVHYRQCFVENKFSRSTVIDPSLHIGLGEVTTVDIRVRFPSGITREVKGAKAGTPVTVAEAP
ncbi:MAG: CRTAC1 family protein [Planctomycetota bacterium]|jgi:hypothetical protein